MSGYGGRTLPEVILVGLDRTESKLGKVMMWASLPFVAIPTVAFFVSSAPMSEKIPALYIAGMFAFFTGAGFFLSRKRLRVHRSAFAQTLLHRPEAVERVTAELRVPQAGGVRQVSIPMNGQVEFEPLPERTIRVLFFKVYPNMWVSVKLKGKLLTRKLVVPQHRGAELLSWLFATIAAANPECGWGEGKVADHVG